MDKYWVAHPDDVFCPCTCEVSGDKVHFIDPDGKRVTNKGSPLTHSVATLGELPKVHEPQLLGVGNVCELVVVDNAAVLHTVRTRYKRSDIYTFVSKMLVAVNPFKELAVYSKENLIKYLGASSTMDLPPHIYALGLHAVKGLQQNGGTSQVVLISGESGAGKTESAKLVMSYISEAIGSSRQLQRRESRPRYSVAFDPATPGQSRRKSRYSVIDPAKPSIQDKIIQTNPILEAFGNAMTVRNNNSSRFGKWTQMIISPNMTIEGCSVTDYLLEVTRVCGSAEKERNYHIFFQLLQARDDPELQDLGIEAPQEYNYIKGSQLTAPGIDDARCFLEVKEAFLALSFSLEVQKEIFKVVVGLLVLGNIDIADGDEAKIEGNAAVSKASQLLGIDPEALKSMILIQQRKVGTEVMNSQRTPPQAKSVRDTFARMLYGRTFKWLIEKINEKLRESSTSQVFLGVLDIAGFESFERNSLEQLFINLSNEILQSHFNQHFFRMELKEYEAEGIEVGIDIKYQDNSDIVSLINAKGGILSLLDDEASLPRTTDETFVSKVIRAHGDHTRIVRTRMGGAGAVKFGIKHFAGEVTYDATGFLEKNRAKLPDEAAALLCSSSSSILQEIGKKVTAEVEAESRSKGRKVKTVSSGFRQSLEDLMQTVNSAEPHFIRCLKPNPAKAPDNFDSKYTYEQMLYSGIFEAVRIRQSGFPMRLLHADFVERYCRCLPKEQWPELVGPRQVPEQEKLNLVVTALRKQLAQVDLPDQGLAVGTTKVLGKALTMSVLEEIRHKALLSQKQDQEAAKEEITRAIKARDPEALLAALVQGELLQLEQNILEEAKRALEYEERRAKVMEVLNEAISVREVIRLRAAIQQAKDFGLEHPDDLAILEEAVVTMQRELWPQARSGLAQAVLARDVKKLQEALAEAQLVGLAADETKPARQALREEERKAAAIEGLKDPLLRKDIAAMQSAIAEGEEAGLTDADLEQIRKALAEEERKVNARTALQTATKSRKVPAIQAALEEAEACQLEGPEIYEAKRTLAEEQSKMQARTAVQQAMQSRDVTELRAALKQGFAWGLEEADLQRARMILKQEEIKLEALRALEDALRSRDIEDLQAAIRNGQSSNLDPSQLRPARTALEEEQKKVSAKSSLEKAIKRRDINALLKALADGEKAGLVPEDEEMMMASATLAAEQAKAAAKELLAQAVRDLSYDTIPNLRAAIQEAELQLLDAVLLDPAKTKLETSERQLAAKTDLRDALASGDIEDLSSAISNAEHAGLPSADEHLSEARRLHAEEKRRVKARQGLFDAVQSRDIERLQKAIEEGQACKIDEDDIREASDVLMEENRKANAREGLQRATWSRSILDLKSAILEAEDAGVDEEEMMEARQMLGVEERKEEARSNLAAATQNRDVEMLEDALEEADRCGLLPTETQLARQVLAEEQWKISALEHLSQAIASKDIAALEAALSEAENAGVEAVEVDTAKSLLEQELQKTYLWQSLMMAQEERDITALRDHLSSAISLGFSLSELASAQAVLKEEERKESAREALSDAVLQKDVGALHRALNEAVECGLRETELASAQDTLAVALQLAETRRELESAMKSRDPARLAAAIAKGQQCELGPELEAANAVLKEAWAEQAKKSLRKAIAEQDVRALFRAVAESEAVGLEPEELEDAKRALEREAASAAQDFEERILERKAQLLLPAAELTFEVARPALQAEGYGGFDWKVRENIAFTTVAVGQELAVALEKAWFTKKSDILDELCHNLRSCSMSSTGRVCKVEALDRRVLLKLGLELKSQLGHESSTSWASSPIVMVAMLLYTQQDVDTDRSMLFPDCPSSAVGQRLFREKKEAYDAYRTRVASGLATRNPMLFTEVSHVAAAVLQSALQGMQDGSRSAEPLQKWVKTACLLSSCREKAEDSRTLTRILMNVSDRGIQELQNKQKEDIIVCPHILSTSLNPDYVEKYLHLGAWCLERHVVLSIRVDRDVTECLNLSAISQYPEEKEVLLPFLSVLRIQDISFGPGEPTRISCQFQGSMMSSRLRSACLSDLTMASYELVQGLEELPTPSPLSLSLEQSKLDRSNIFEPNQYNSKVFQSLVHAFEALDRRGAWMISLSDYSWAQDRLASSFAVKRILRKLTPHFAKTHDDLSLQKFFTLTMPGATDVQLEKAFRWTSRYLRNAEPRHFEESPVSPQTPQTPVIRSPSQHRLPTWR
ncbi:unnamed protein product [Durusdinium trenchii]|uniref:Myosin motor domain-containing protein n=2 Tax=Durusdinium trenchii TaxID=1381693 RepID=A0ABP0R9K6_9DINO